MRRQFYSNQPVRGCISLGAFLLGGGATAFLGVKTGIAGGDYQDFVDYRKTTAGENQLIEEFCGSGCTRQSPSFDQTAFNAFVSAREDSLYDDYRNWVGRTIFGAVITGGIWALNIADAAIAGAQSRKKVQLYFESSLRDEFEIGIAGRF